MKDLSIIIVNYNTKKLLLGCIKSILDNTKSIKYEILVIDNASRDGSVPAVKTRFTGKPISVYQLSENKGFAAANNVGISKAKGRFMLFLNSDTLVQNGVIDEMVEWMDLHPKSGISTCSLTNPDGSLQGTGGYFPTLSSVFAWMTIQDLPFVDNFIKPFHPMHSKSFAKGNEFYFKKRQLDWVTGAYMLVRSEVLNKIGNWDEGYFMYTEEVDLCYRAKKAGWQVWYLPQWEITHFGGASSTSEFPILSEYKGVKRFYRKFYPKWQYPILRILLKIGAIGRMAVFGILEGRSAVKIYGKAYKIA